MSHYHHLFLSLLFLLLLTLSALLPPSLSQSTKPERCHPDDKRVLLKIKNAFNNPYILASWRPEFDCCTWYCVKCDRTTHRITSLTIFSGDLPGKITPHIGDLPFLQTLMLHKLSNLTGPLPSSLTKLKYLKYLTLSWINLTGPVPDFLGQIPSLVFIDLSFNDLTGPIPPSLGYLPNLGSLRLDRNKLTGPIPESFGNFKGNDFYLYLSHNQLSGEIPASFEKAEFTYLDVSRNKLTGGVSMLFGADKNYTQTLDFSRNMFEFNFSSLEIPTSLIYLDFNHNKLYGGIPESITKVDFLQHFNVSYNRLCGKIPVGGERLARFDSTAYFHNRCLCGAPLDSCK